MIDLKVINVNGSNTYTPEFYSIDITTGINSLTQRIIKLLLTTRGSDYFNTNTGSQLMSLYGVYNDDQLEQVKDVMYKILKNFEITVLKEQNDLKKIGFLTKPEDNLKELNILSIDHDEENSNWEIKINITNELNESLSIQL